MSGTFTVLGGPAPTIADWLVGVPPATLQQWLAQAQAAYQSLATGALPQTVTYANGQGNRSVTYHRSSQAMLLAHIRQINAALGNSCARRGLPVRF